jgi:hypothetical protein
VLLEGVLAGGLIASQARATTVITNTATANFKNEAAQAQPSVNGSTVFTSQSEPVLSVVKTGDKAQGPVGTIVTWTIRVAYPKLAGGGGLCGDDSKATNVVITDPVPAGFLHVANSTEVSTDDGTTWTGVNDGSSGNGFTVAFAGTTVTVNTPDLVEGQGDPAGSCAPVADVKALAFRFKATKQ